MHAVTSDLKFTLQISHKKDRLKAHGAGLKVNGKAGRCIKALRRNRFAATNFV
jgi:hypothetical protein